VPLCDKTPLPLWLNNNLKTKKAGNHPDLHLHNHYILKLKRYTYVYGVICECSIALGINAR
jgi:hypothetical protein